MHPPRWRALRRQLPLQNRRRRTSLTSRYSVSHSHHHQTDFGRAFAIGVLLNTGFIVAEVVFGLVSHSLALLADAGHNLGDVMGLLMAWAATSLGRRSPTERFTYGLRRTSVLAALFNA